MNMNQDRTFRVCIPEGAGVGGRRLTVSIAARGTVKFLPLSEKRLAVFARSHLPVVNAPRFSHDKP